MLQGTVSAISDTSCVRPAWGLPRYPKGTRSAAYFRLRQSWIGRTVSDLGVGSYAQGAVAEAGVAVGCVSSSRRYSHPSEKATQSGADRPNDPVPDSCDSGRGIKLGD